MNLKFKTSKNNQFNFEIKLENGSIFLDKTPYEIYHDYHKFMTHRFISHVQKYHEDVGELHKFDDDFAIKLEGLNQDLFLCFKLNKGKQDLFEYSFRKETEYRKFNVPIFLI